MPIKIVNSSAKHYQIRKEKLEIKVHERYQNFSEQKKRKEQKKMSAWSRRILKYS